MSTSPPSPILSTRPFGRAAPADAALCAVSLRRAPRRAWPLAALALALVAVLAWAWLSRPVSQVALPPSGCDLGAGACSEVLPGGGQMHFSVGPWPIAAGAPLALELRFSDARISAVEVAFDGANMRMVPNRAALSSVDGRRYVGEATLSLCVSGDMRWQAEVGFERDGTRYTRTFEFDSVTPTRVLEGDRQ